MPDAPAPKTSAFRTPGEGSSVAISAITVVALFFLWWLVTHMGWIKPLFLPKPLAVLEQLAAEPEMHRLHSSYYAYEFFVARRGLD